MRYHYKKPDIYLSMYGKLYICNHPVYDRCTLFTIGDTGLFSKDLIRIQRLHIGLRLIPGLQILYICILGLKNFLMNELESVRMDYILQ